MTWKIETGDCRIRLRDWPVDHFDACVTDPPYEIGFMGKTWDSDGVSFRAHTWSCFLRVLRPGGYLLAFGSTRTAHRIACAIEDAGFEIRDTAAWLFGNGFPKSQSLKPAYEPIIIAQKPGAAVGLNIESCRTDAGRWPANVMLDETAAKQLDEQAGDRRSAGNYPSTSTGRGDSSTSFRPKQGRLYADKGGASRFFYVSKASVRERNTGCAIRNDHPTVKPVELMRHLVRLVTPATGEVLDPFCGSGTTGVACIAEGMSFTGIERDVKFAEIARQRLAHADKEAA